MEEDFFEKKRLRRQSAQIEFRHFKKNYGKIILAHKSRSQHFQSLDKAFDFADFSDGAAHFQIGFQRRFSGYDNHKGEPVHERGTQLVYSHAASGHTACLLYPTKSNASNVFEDFIYLRSGFFTGNQLLNYLKKDLKDLETYLFVSSADMTPNWKQRLRISWLRRTHPLQLNDKHFRPKLFGYIGKASDFTFRTMLISIFKPVGLIVVIVILIALNLSPLVEFLDK